VRFNLPRLYAITDRRISGLSHAEQVMRLADGGASFIQLREKHLSPREFYREAEEALRVARERGMRLIINDRVDIALALKADGVHLGQTDLDPRAARGLLGDEAIIGYSTHTLAQAMEAANLPIDYIAFGPVFATLSKDNPDAVVGLDGLRDVRARLGGDAWIVAIGGITFENASAVLAAGANTVAVISALLKDSAAIASRTRELQARLAFAKG